MVAPVLIQYGLPFLVQVLSEALRRIDSDAARTASDSLDKMQDVINGGTVPPEQMAEANRHAEAIARMQVEEIKSGYEQVNESLRAEVASEDAYVRRMRPTFGYLMAMTWAAQMFGLAYVIIFETERANVVLQAMESLSTIWAVGLSVLGIYVYKRSEEKRGQITGIPLPKIKPVIAKFND